MDNSPNLVVLEDDLIKLIEEYLEKRDYHVTLRTLERESSITNCDYSDVVLFVRELVLDGDFDEVLRFGDSLKSIESNETFDQRKFNYIVLRQKFIELIYKKAHVLDKQNIETVSEVMKTLSRLEKHCESKENYNNLCWLLTLPDLNSHDDFIEWNLDVSRLKCFNDVLDCLSLSMPLVKRKTGLKNTASKDRLLQLIVKGLLYETCTSYCHSVTNTLTDDKLNLETNLFDCSTDAESSFSLLSWILGLPAGVFELPFNMCNINLCYSKSCNPTKKTDQILLNQSLDIKKLKNSKIQKPTSSNNNSIIMDKYKTYGLNNRSFDMPSSKILSSSLPATELRKGISSGKNSDRKSLHSSLNMGMSHTNNLYNPFGSSWTSPPVMSSSAMESNISLNAKNPNNTDRREVQSSIEEKVSSLKTTIKQSNPFYATKDEKQAGDKDIDQVPDSPPKKPVAFDLFEPKTPDKEVDEKKRREEIMEKLKKHEQNRQESVKTLQTNVPVDTSPNVHMSDRNTKESNEKKGSVKKSTEASPTDVHPEQPTVKKQYFSFDKDTLGAHQDPPESTKQPSDEIHHHQENLHGQEHENAEPTSSGLSKENSSTSSSSTPPSVRGPVINGVRRPPRNNVTAAEKKNATVLAEKKERNREPRSEKFKRSSSYEKQSNQEIRASYDISSGRTLQTDIVPQYKAISLLEDTQAIRSVCFHPSGQLHAIGANSKVFRICKTVTKQDGANRNEVSSMEVVFSRNKFHRGSIYCMAWDPEGRFIATGSNDKTIKMIQFDHHNFTQIGDDVEFNIHPGTVRDLSFVPNRNGYLISGGAGSGSVNITDVNAQKVVGTFDGHSGNILTVFVGDAGELVATGGTDNTLRLWDLRSQRCIDVIVVGESSPASVALSGDNNYVASGQEDGSILLYDITAGRTLHTMRLHKSDCRSVRFSPDSNYLMTASYDSSISLMNIRSDLEWNPPRHYSVARHSDKVIQCRWHPRQNLLLSSSADRTCVLWKGSDF